MNRPSPESLEIWELALRMHDLAIAIHDMRINLSQTNFAAPEELERLDAAEAALDRMAEHAMDWRRR